MIQRVYVTSCALIQLVLCQRPNTRWSGRAVNKVPVVQRCCAAQLYRWVSQMNTLSLFRFCAIYLLAVFGYVLSPPLYGEEAGALSLPTVIKGPPSGGFDFYPLPARRLSQEGRVVVAFTISSDGHVVDARVADADPKGVFDKSAITYVRGTVFSVPSGWDASEGSHHEYTMSFVYRIQPCPGTVPVELPPFPADYKPIIVTAGTFGCSGH